MSVYVGGEHPVRLLDVDGQAFGASVVATLVDGQVPEGRLALPTQRAVRNLQLGVQAVYRGERDIDREARSEINETFGNDEQSARAAMQWAEATTRPTNIVGWLARAPMRRVVEFSVYNSARHSDLQAAFERDRQLFDDNTREKTRLLIDDGLFPKQAWPIMEAAIARRGIFLAIDSFEAGALGVKGYRNENGTAALANCYQDRHTMMGMTDDMLETAFHEDVHSVERYGQRGFVGGIATKLGQYWLEEAVAAHVASVARNRTDPLPGVFDVAKRNDPWIAIYPGERTATGLLLSPDLANIPADKLVAGFFSGWGSKLRLEIETKLGQAVDKIVGTRHGVGLATFTTKYNLAGSRVESDQLVEDLLNKLYDYRGQDVIQEYAMPSEEIFDPSVLAAARST